MTRHTGFDENMGLDDDQIEYEMADQDQMLLDGLTPEQRLDRMVAVWATKQRTVARKTARADALKQFHVDRINDWLDMTTGYTRDEITRLEQAIDETVTAITRNRRSKTVTTPSGDVRTRTRTEINYGDEQVLLKELEGRMRTDLIVAAHTKTETKDVPARVDKKLLRTQMIVANGGAILDGEPLEQITTSVVVDVIIEAPNQNPADSFTPEELGLGPDEPDHT